MLKKKVQCIQYIDTSKKFLNRTRKGDIIGINRTSDKGDIIKLRNVCIAKELINQVKRQIGKIKCDRVNI